MPIQIQAQGFTLTDLLERHILQRIDAGLGTHIAHASLLRVSLRDINGPKGGADKHCRVHIALPKQPDIVVNDTQTNMYRAIDSALRRARHALTRRHSRKGRPSWTHHQ